MTTTCEVVLILLLLFQALRYITQNETFENLDVVMQLLEEDNSATTNVQNGLVFSFYFLLVSFRLFVLKQK